MPGGNFDDEQVLRQAAPRGVDGKGPLEGDADVKEMCIWFVQHRDDGDAAATEMTTSVEGRDAFAQTPLGQPNREWTLPTGTISGESLEPGPAFALAIALVRDDATGDEKVRLWGQTVVLK